MRNAKEELLKHIGCRKVKYVFIRYREEYSEGKLIIKGTLEEVLNLLDFTYDSGYGGQ